MKNDRRVSICVLTLALLAPALVAQTPFHRHFPADHVPVDIASGWDHLPYVADAVLPQFPAPDHELLTRFTETGDALASVDLIGHQEIIRAVAPVPGRWTGVLREGASGGSQQNFRVPFVSFHDANLMHVWAKEIVFGFPATQVQQVMPLSMKADPNSGSFVIGGTAWTDPVVAGFPWFARVRSDGSLVFAVSFPVAAPILAGIFKVVPTVDGGIIGVGYYNNPNVAPNSFLPFAMKVDPNGHLAWARTYRLLDVVWSDFGWFNDVDNRVEHGSTYPGTYVVGDNAIYNSLGQIVAGPFTARIDEASGDLTNINLHVATGHRLAGGNSIVHDLTSEQLVVGGWCADLLADGSGVQGSQQAMIFRTGGFTSGTVYGDGPVGLFESQITELALNPAFGNPNYSAAYFGLTQEHAFLTSPDRFLRTRGILRTRRDLTGTPCSSAQNITSFWKAVTWTNLPFNAQYGTIVDAGLIEGPLPFDLTACSTYPSASGPVVTPQAAQLQAPRADRSPLANLKLISSDMSRNQILHGVDGADGTFYSFYVDVPPNTSAVTFSIAGNNGDADLYVRRAGPPTFTLWDWRPYTSASNESVTVNAPAPGRWYFAVHGYRDYRKLTLRAQTW